MLSAWENTLLLFLYEANGGFALWTAQALLQCRAFFPGLLEPSITVKAWTWMLGEGVTGENWEPEGGLASHEACSRQPSCSLIRAPSITLPCIQFVGLDLAIMESFPFLISKPKFLLKPLKSFSRSNFGFFPLSFIILATRLSWAPYPELSNVSSS